MTDEGVGSFGLGGEDLFDHYESIRREALGSGGRWGQGLSLFISRGMKAWLGALRVFHSVSSFREEVSHGQADLPASVWSDLVPVLADMVLACWEEEKG